jgi:hypothetical protein
MEIPRARSVAPVGLSKVPLGGSSERVFARSGAGWRACSEGGAGVGRELKRLVNERGEQARDGDLLPSPSGSAAA